MTAATPLPASAAPRRGRRLRSVPAAPPTPPLVARERLLERLAAPGPARVVVLTAPAGYGKTTLLETWAADDPRPVHWLRTGRDDAAPAAVGALADALADAEGPIVVIVDGDRLGRCPATADALGRLAAAVPPGSLLVLSTRGATLPHLARLRVERGLVELGPRELALTRAEAAALLALAGAEPGAAEREALAVALEGWPAALGLVTAAVADGQRAGETVPSADVDPHLAAYVRDEVLRGLPRELREFLLRCSVVDELDPDLCDVLMERDGAHHALQELDRWGVPMGRGDRGRPPRCHPVLRAVLAVELQRSEPALGRRLRIRAATWLEERGRTGEAIDQLLTADALDDAAALLWPLTASWAWDGNVGRIAAWLERLPVRRVERHAALAGSAAACALVRGHFAHARRWTTLAARALPELPVQLARSVHGGLELLTAMSAAPDAAGLCRHAAAADRLLDADDPWRATACFVGGFGEALRGDAQRARDELEAGILRGLVGPTGVAALCESTLALMATCTDDEETAVCLAERARGRIAALDAREHPMLALVVAVAALARAHRGRYAEARTDLALLDVTRSDPWPPPGWYAAPLALAAGRAQLRVSETAAGAAALREAARAAAALADASALHGWIAAARTRSVAAGHELPDGTPLTAAELRVLRFLPSHLSFREIGAQLYVSPNTIKTQVHAVYRKLGASSRSAAVARAARLGLIDQDAWTSPASGDAVARGRA